MGTFACKVDGGTHRLCPSNKGADTFLFGSPPTHGVSHPRNVEHTRQTGVTGAAITPVKLCGDTSLRKGYVVQRR